MKRQFCVFIFFSLYLGVFGQDKFAKVPPKTRVSFFPNVSFYKNDVNSANTVPKKSFGICVKEEFYIEKITRLLIGLTYLNQGLTFESYYRAPGYPLTANTGYNFVHKINFQEVRLPVQAKLNFNGSEEKDGNGYLFFGWEGRFIFKTKAEVSEKQTGTLIWANKNEKLEMEHKFIFKQAGSELAIGSGYEYKVYKHKHAVFMELCYHYSLSRFIYTGNNDSNFQKIKNHNLEFGVGYKF